MPDKFDYEWLAERLRRPEAWSEEDYGKLKFLARNQREALASFHPLDRKGHARAERAAEKMERAIAAYEESRPPQP